LDILEYILLFFVPALAGVSVFFLPKKRLVRSIDYIKLFGASFFLGVIVMHLLPEIFHEADKNVGLFVALGFFFQVLLETFTGSEPHDHVLPEEGSRYTLSLLIGLGIHAFFEGFPLADTFEHLHHAHAHAEDTYLTGVLLHKIPVVIILVMMMLSNGLSKKSTLIQMLVFSAMTPLGLFAGGFIPDAGNLGLYILAFVVGSISHVAMHLILTRDVGQGSRSAIFVKVLLMIFGFSLVYFLG
jgi:zinc and cadmium transporter